MTDDTDMVVEGRRRLLREWIASRYGGVQAAFIEDTGVNQGELSGLLKSKSFGEKRARSLEKKARMPAFYLDQPQRKVEETATDSHSHLVRLDPERIAELATVLAERWKDVPGGFDLRNETHAAHFVHCYGLYINMKERPVPENTVAFSAALTSPQGAKRDERGEDVPAAGTAGRRAGKGGKR